MATHPLKYRLGYDPAWSIEATPGIGFGVPQSFLGQPHILYGDQDPGHGASLPVPESEPSLE